MYARDERRVFFFLSAFVRGEDEKTRFSYLPPLHITVERWGVCEVQHNEMLQRWGGKEGRVEEGIGGQGIEVGC